MYLSLTFGKTLDLTLLKLAESAVYIKLLRLDHAELLTSRCGSGLPVKKFKWREMLGLPLPLLPFTCQRARCYATASGKNMLQSVVAP